MNGFPGIDIIERPDKPRDEGITMMIDWGLGLGQLADLLDQAGAYVDIAKIAVGTAALIPQELLAEKIRLYAHRGVTASPGGQFLEYAYTQGRAAAFFESCQRAGFSCVEVSTNEVDIDAGEKARLIRAAVDDYGFKVLGETGSKHAASTPETLVADARNMLDAGAWKIFVEAAECFVDGVFQRRVIDHLIRRVALSDLIFELPGPWIRGIRDDAIHELMIWLILELGHNVNIANLHPDRVLYLETQRRGIGVKHRQPRDILAASKPARA